MILRRIVFGEPKPGESTFAGLLSKLDESVSYCNRTGPRQHDRVTDLPFAIPALKLNYVHPVALSFVSANPDDNDPLGIFRFHHMKLYDQGIRAATDSYLHIDCARLCRGLYAYPDDTPIAWDERKDTADIAWAVKLEGKTAYVVFRGSYTLLDWLRDLVGFAPSVPHATFGPMWGGFLIGMEYAWAEIKPLIAGADEVAFTGHSLGAARASIAAGYALQDFSTGTQG
jgi:hypothetical protein